MNLEKPVYHTVKEEGLLQVFTSSLVFNEVKYTGEVCRTKKDSELLAARALIISILGKSDTGIMMAAIVKSKSKKHYDLLNNGRTIAPQDYVVAEVVNPETSLVIQPDSQVEELVVVTRTDDNSKGLLLPHTTNVHHPDPSDNSKGLLQLVPLSLDEKPLDVEGGGPPENRKRSMNNSTTKNNKKLCINAQVDSSVAEMKMGQVLADVVHSNEAPSCSVGP
ncbi:uncharacterized protein LOC124932987 [Impatiens glandulifera]|uniref:uncharacterized protein LOC124928995 n=1 Tax=Impatiens glandulifera TaxID=253017 RepID=UPI001FB08725|nr:uncharacterized protein LOC124928995 [Impatiens glandulifera]XP_047329664.1 uncharacterized protein LOC124932987 [Impatiens glandulifera]